jgi:hypothetical protein
MVANEQHNGYELLVEVDDAALNRCALAEAVDRHLEEGNIEYHAKRASGRLKPLTVMFLRRGAAEAHQSACVQAGQREAQFKPTVLQYGKDLRWQPDEYVLS